MNTPTRNRGLRHLADAPIRFKLLILVFASLAFPFSLAILLIGSNYSAVDSFRRDVDIYAAVNRLKTANTDNLARLGTFLESGTMEDLNRYNQGIDLWVSVYKDLQRDDDDIEVALLLHSIWNSFDSWYEEAHLSIRKRITVTGEYYSSYYRAERIGRYLDGYISQLLDRTLVVGTETYRARVDRARITRTIAIATLFAFAGICVGFGLFFAGFITRPLQRLAAAASRMAGGDLEVGALPVGPAYEVGTLTLSFNSMNAHIVTLVRDLKEKAALERRLHSQELRNARNQKMRKEAEFLALQARINPHFLFNTLNTISRDVMLREGKDTIALVESLSALLRYGLEQGAGIVTLGTELEIVRKYAFIQHYRFDNLVSITIDCRLDDPETVHLPAFSIQPLVENAFIKPIPAIFAKAVATFGHVDITINNAGIIKRNDSVDFTEQEWDDVMNINVKSVFFMCQAAARQYIAQKSGGKIVNVASMLSFQGGIRGPSYTASKSGVKGITMLMANEWAKHGINTNALAPGYMATDNTAPLRADAERSAAILERIPANRWGEPRDLGGAVVFLSSKASDYINGYTIAVDGGWLGR